MGCGCGKSKKTPEQREAERVAQAERDQTRRNTLTAAREAKIAQQQARREAQLAAREARRLARHREASESA